MILLTKSDSAYFVMPEAKSWIVGFYLSNKIPNPPLTPTPPCNGPLHIVSKTLHHVVASAAESETTALFFNSSQEAIPIQYIISKLGHLQSLAPTKTDNATALAFIKSNICQK